jgi:hypothetical protein
VTKPKFTPDPPPVGASQQELLAWEKAQFDRIEDWWPKNLEDRLKALEIAFPYKSGTWPIVDVASLDFTATVDIPEAACSDAIWPVVSTETGPFVADVSNSGYNLEVQDGTPAIAVNGDGEADTTSNWLSTDLPPGATTDRSWDMSYIYVSSVKPNTYLGVSLTRDIGKWTLTAGYLELWIKRTTTALETPFDPEYILHASAPNRQGFTLYIRGTGNDLGPCNLTFEAGLEGTNAYVRYRTDDAVITRDTWHKIRVNWEPDELGPTTFQNAATILVDDVSVDFTATTFGTVTSWEPSDIDDYSNPAVDPDRLRARMVVGGASIGSNEQQSQNFNGLVNEIFISHCGFI